MGLSVERLEFLLLIAAILAMLARRIRIPYTVVLVAAGILLALASIGPDVPLTRSLVFDALLPPLVFEAAFAIPWPNLKRDLGVISTLATAGVAIAAAVVACGMHWLAHWPWGAACLFGVLIAATDPVSVIAIFKETGAGGRLRLLMEAESLFNDGTAAAGFAVVMAILAGSAAGTVSITWALLATVLGGIPCGLAVGAGALLLSGRTEDHLVEITFTTVAAYGSFLLADRLQVSGVLAALTAGLVMGNAGQLGEFTERGREAIQSFWEYVAFVANSLIFLLMGMRLGHQSFVGMAGAVAAGIVLVLIGRAAAVYLFCAPFAWSRQRVTMREQHALVWGGLRGALALALVLSLPAGIPRRAEITAVAFAVVAFSVIVQGLTVRPLIRKQPGP